LRSQAEAATAGWLPGVHCDRAEECLAGLRVITETMIPSSFLAASPSITPAGVELGQRLVAVAAGLGRG
jgi:hypothetical protein